MPPATQRTILPTGLRLTDTDFLRCGNLAAGFSRFLCHGCGHQHLLAFTCKSRHFCRYLREPQSTGYKPRQIGCPQSLLTQTCRLASPHRLWYRLLSTDACSINSPSCGRLCSGIRSQDRHQGSIPRGSKSSLLRCSSRRPGQVWRPALESAVLQGLRESSIRGSK
jgi:hypothetical protein